MKKRQYVILSVVWFTAIALLATAFYIYTIDFLINQIKYAIRETQSPLAVSFRFPNNTANPTANWVNTNNKQITFQIPPKFKKPPRFCVRLDEMVIPYKCNKNKRFYFGKFSLSNKI